MPVVELVREAWPVLVAHVAGATPFGYFAGRLRGIDIRDHGSGNIGATNAIRVLGKPIGFTVFALDVLKGLLPVLLALRVTESSTIHVAAALAAILGHNHTFWLGFKGGKGVATTAGAILPLFPWALLAAVAAWLVTALVTRYVSVASIVAAIVIPTALATEALIRGRWDPVIFGFGLLVCALAIWKHRSNLRRLARGEENRMGRKTSPPSDQPPPPDAGNPSQPS